MRKSFPHSTSVVEVTILPWWAWPLWSSQARPSELPSLHQCLHTHSTPLQCLQVGEEKQMNRSHIFTVLFILVRINRRSNVACRVYCYLLWFWQPVEWVACWCCQSARSSLPLLGPAHPEWQDPCGREDIHHLIWLHQIKHAISLTLTHTACNDHLRYGLFKDIVSSVSRPLVFLIEDPGGALVQAL